MGLGCWLRLSHDRIMKMYQNTLKSDVQYFISLVKLLFSSSHSCTGFPCCSEHIFLVYPSTDLKRNVYFTFCFVLSLCFFYFHFSLPVLLDYTHSLLCSERNFILYFLSVPVCLWYCLYFHNDFYDSAHIEVIGSLELK